ncbi:hypothetical protein BC830DRAFT_1136141 [Chytriomyces sp. MP71]|nr:hypothetical protein BC830DRAFT_1136141 [Chytriomyces sp. MP71]
MFGILIHQLIELGNSAQLIALVNAILNALNERVEQDLQRDTVEESIFWLANVRQLISIAQGIKVLPIVQGATWKLNFLLEHLINELENLSWKTLFAGISDNLCEESITLALDVFFSDDEGGVADLESLVLSIHNACKSYHLQESLNVRILTEILANIGVNIFNELLAREGWLTSKRARKIRLDVNSMEQAFIALDLPLDYDYFGMLLEAMRAISMVKEDGTLEVESVLEEMTLLNVQQVYRIVCSCVSQCLVPLSARESLRTEALASKLPLKASVEDLQIEFDRPVVVPIKIESSFALVPPKLKLFGDLSLLFRQIMILHQ